MSVALVGFIWAKQKLPFDNDGMAKLVLYVGAPSLVISTLSKVNLSLDVFIQVAGFVCVITLITVVLAFIWVKINRLPTQPYLACLLFPNTGNMGLPLCLFTFGETGLAIALAYFMLLSVVHFSLGTIWYSKQISIRALATNPILLSIVVALLLMSLDLTLPTWVANSLDLTAGFTIPLMLIALGISLSQLRVENLKVSVAMAVGRLIIGFGAAWLVTEALGITGEIRGVLIIESAMPVAVFNYVFAKMYHREPEDVAGIVMCSTLLTFLVLPLLISVAM